MIVKPLCLPDLSSFGQYFRIGAISLEEGLERIKIAGFQRVYGVHVTFVGARLKTYLYKGIKCISCERQGHYFALEKCKYDQPKNKYHINLWGITETGKHYMMTSDHIVPRSRGGRDVITNRQPMCARCNNKKGQLLPGENKYDCPKQRNHNLCQGMLKIMRQSLERELRNERVI